MNLTRWTPWNWFTQEEESGSRNGNGSESRDYSLRRMDNLFEDFVRRFEMPMTARFLHPRVNISETDNEYLIEAEIPGVEPKDIEVQVVDRNLILTGETRREEETRERHFHRVERRYGSFRRVLTLPEDADDDTVEARFDKGILRITVGRDQEARTRSRKIEVKAS